MSPREVQLRNQMVCLMVANGETIEAVARKLQTTEKVIEMYLKTPQAQDMVVRFQHDIAPEPRARVAKMANVALDVQTRLLLGGASDTVKASVAQSVLDRHLGKATQVLETRSMHFDLKDSVAIDNALKASQEKLKKIEDMQKRLAISVTARAA